MKLQLTAAAIALLTTASAWAAPNYRTTNRGVEVTLYQLSTTAPKLVRLQAVADKIIRVSATPEGRFADNQSLVVVPQQGPVPFKVTDDGKSVSLTTAEVRATVNLATGEVSFYDKDGRLILAEDVNGREFVPIEVEGTEAYTVTQRFCSLDDNEGYYGLGQHQADEFNYKGRNEELFQYNTKVSVPFIVSTNNYGVLWDSYSMCRWGNPEPYKQLGDVFTLYDKDGREGALTGIYTAAGAAEPTLVQREDSIYFEHLIRGDLAHVVNLPQTFPFAGSTVVYEGEIEAPADGTYRFNQYYSGYQTIYIDGREVVPQRWRTAWNPNSYKFAVDLKRGQRVPIRIEWEPNGSTAYAGLRVYAPVPEAEQQKMCWWGEMQSQEDYYFVYGTDMDDVISGYRTLTGKAPIMPRWVLGFWQSREKYNTSDELLTALAGFRERGIPIDNIVLDWLHWREDSWGSHEFDPVRFPDPKQMIDSVHAMNGRFMISVWPKFYVTTEHYREFDRNGWMYQLAVTDSIRDWVGPGYLGSFYDAYSPQARQLFWGQMREHYFPLGVDAWWMDASEPNIRDCTDLQYRKDLCGPTALGPSCQYFNAYGLMNAQAIYDGQRSADPDRRVFLLTRSGFAGQQRYSTATWSGDIATRWEDMKAQISAGLNFAASGIPWWSMDIGGFCVEDRYVAAQKEFEQTGTENADLREWRELNARWYQFGAFAPMYRAHGQWPFREVYNLAPADHPAYRSIVYYTKLRYDLMPYLYSMAGMTHFDDYTIMRPMVMDFTADLATRDIGDQYMFGPALLVAPVYTYEARSRDVYFPEGAGWYDFYTGAYTEGGRTATVDAPYERIPLYVRTGSILPVGPDLQWSDERPADEITLFVYTGDDGSFTIYEDENVNYNYEQGQYSRIPITYDDARRQVTIGDREGAFPGMLDKRTFNIVKIDRDKPRGYDKRAKGKRVTYTGKAKVVKI